MDNLALAALLFPDMHDTPADLETQFPPRRLPEGAKVTRIAPSPTGFMHLGNLYGAFADERLAHQSGGVFYLRIEDTDQKREVQGGVETILDVFDYYGLMFDEGATADGDQGSYGPYRQRQRARTYQVCAKWLVEQGRAYPCFCTEGELADIRRIQEEKKENFGYYGPYARHRDWTLDQIQAELQKGTSYVIRYRSEGDPARRVKFTDLIHGAMEFPENDQDVVLLKSDGIPTYHFAHVVDDHLMRTTHVVRGEEWLATLPIHVQLFGAMGWKAPKYVHTAQLMKMDGGSKRKLSKRKDPELALDFYKEQGYCVDSVREYLMTLLNSNFEDWRLANPDTPFDKFPFSTNKMGVSGALFDIDKLRDVSKNVICRMTAEQVYEHISGWAAQYDTDFYALLSRDADYARRILAIGRGGKKPRKDLAVWNEAKVYMGLFYDELFALEDTFPERAQGADAHEILTRYTTAYDHSVDSAAWFEQVKGLAQELGYTTDMKAFKKDPAAFKGNVSDVSAVLRVAVTGRQNSPDLWEIMQLLGETRVRARLDAAIARLA